MVRLYIYTHIKCSIMKAYFLLFLIATLLSSYISYAYVCVCVCVCLSVSVSVSVCVCVCVRHHGPQNQSKGSIFIFLLRFIHHLKAELILMNISIDVFVRIEQYLAETQIFENL